MRGDEMEKAVETTQKDETSFTRDVLNLALYYLWRASNWARSYLGGRRGLILLAVAVLGAGTVLNWGWLVAIAVAPILLALAPCAVMCAVGVCAMKGGGKSCPSGDQTAKACRDPTEITHPRTRTS